MKINITTNQYLHFSECHRQIPEVMFPMLIPTMGIVSETHRCQRLSIQIHNQNNQVIAADKKEND